MDQVLHWVDQYGYIILFLSLCLELIAFPIPTEPLMAYVGYLAFQGQMSWAFSILVAASGSFAGMTVSYWIGFKLGYPFFQRYGRRFHLGEEQLDKMSAIFYRYGLKFLFIAFFIPGIRHLGGYVSGISRIRYRTFAFYSGIGVLIWTTTLISLGKVLGPQWQLIGESAKKYMIVIAVVLALAVVVIYLIRTKLDRIKSFILTGYKTVNATYRSQTRLKLLITATSVIFIVFVSFSVGVVQDTLGGDYGEFNHTSLLIFTAIFQHEWSEVMKVFLYFSSKSMLAVAIGLSVVWIVTKGRDRWLEFRLLMLLLMGGIVYIKVIHGLFPLVASWLYVSFARLSVSQNDTLMLAVMIYGFLAFLVARHIVFHRLKILVTMFALLILLTAGLGHVYFELQLPSDVYVAYVFGGVWLSFVVLLLEALRLLKQDVST